MLDYPISRKDYENLLEYNRIGREISRESFKNFACVNAEYPNVVYYVLRYFLTDVILEYRKDFKEEDKERNVFLIEPAIRKVFNYQIVRLFRSKSALEMLIKA